MLVVPVQVAQPELQAWHTPAIVGLTGCTGKKPAAHSRQLVSPSEQPLHEEAHTRHSDPTKRALFVHPHPPLPSVVQGLTQLVHQSDEEQAEQLSPQAVVQTPETVLLVVKWYPEAHEEQFTVVTEQVLQLRSHV